MVLSKHKNICTLSRLSQISYSIERTKGAPTFAKTFGPKFARHLPLRNFCIDLREGSANVVVRREKLLRVEAFIRIWHWGRSSSVMH